MSHAGLVCAVTLSDRAGKLAHGAMRAPGGVKVCKARRNKLSTVAIADAAFDEEDVSIADSLVGISPLAESSGGDALGLSRLAEAAPSVSRHSVARQPLT